MSWLFSQALVEEYSAGTCLDGAPCALWNGTPTQPASWLPAKTTARSQLSRSGMMYRPLTDDRGKDVLTSFLEAFPAKTSAPPERESESTGSGPVCGHTWHESSVKFDPVSSSWKTHQCLWEEDLPESSVTLPRWGMMRDGVLWERITSGLLTNETGSGLWPTPVATLWKGGTAGKGFPPNLLDAVKMWPTPRTTGLDGGSNSRKAAKERGMWPTPVAYDATTGPNNHYNGLGKMAKTGQMWPTPTVNDSRNDNPPSQALRKTPPLNVVVHMWLTPRTAGMCGGTGHWEMLNQNTTPEEAWKMGAGNGGSLNPTWVEWLMGWPLGWTDLSALETDKFQQWRLSHGNF